MVQGSFCPSRHTRAIACGDIQHLTPSTGHVVTMLSSMWLRALSVKRTCASMAGFLRHSKHTISSAPHSDDVGVI